MSVKEYERRINNITFAEENGKEYAKKIRFNGYIPGQVTYNLGEYPASFKIKPTDYDRELIKSLAEKGVGLIQVHEEWNDSQRVLGADKFSSHDKEGMKEFIALCHEHGIKVLPYISSAYFDIRDKDFDEKFIRSRRADLFVNYFRYIRGNAASPEWNDYLIGKVCDLLDEYDFDGIYNDTGYDKTGPDGKIYGDDDNLGEYDPYFEDLMSRLYTEVKRRGGIVKVHERRLNFPEMKTPVYDYLWVGECVKDPQDILKTVKFDPFVIFCPDFRFSPFTKPEFYFAMTIPFAQFVLRTDGRPITGERCFVPGIDYIVDEDETAHFRKMKEYNDAHPNGPYVYSEWSAIPDDTELRDKWFYYLDLYKPMVKDDSICYMDIKNSPITENKLSDTVHMSLFINEKLFMVISNLGEKEEEITLAEPWVNRETGEKVKTFTLPSGSIRFFKKADKE